MKKKTKVILSVLVVVILASGAFAYKNRNTIEALVHSFSTTEEETVQELEKNKEELQNFIDEDEEINVRDLTEEEAAALASGELSEEDIVKILTGQTEEQETVETTENGGQAQNNSATQLEQSVQNAEPTAAPAAKPAPVSTPAAKKTPSPTKQPEKTAVPAAKPVAKPTATPSQSAESSKAVSELIAKLYVQKSTYLGKLDAIEASVRSEFINNEDSWSSTQQAKKELLSKYLPMVSGWEKECDSTVYGIIDQIKAELQKSGKPDTITETLKSSYVEEKKLKKTYFINRYMD